METFEEAKVRAYTEHARQDFNTLLNMFMDGIEELGDPAYFDDPLGTFRDFVRDFSERCVVNACGHSRGMGNKVDYTRKIANFMYQARFACQIPVSTQTEFPFGDDVPDPPPQAA